MIRRTVAALVALASLAGAAAPAASAHALVTGTSPERGATLDQAPKRVEFRFSEPVETNFGSVKVFDAGGERVDRGRAEHPGGAGDRLAIGLEPGLGDGTYTAAFRVVSADSHPVAGGFTFSVGTGGPAPSKDVADLLGSGASAGTATEIGFGLTRALGYLAIALLAGGSLFAVVVWRRVDAAPGAAEAFESSARRLGVAAIAVGVASSAAGLVFQGATAGGTSFWSALDPAVIDDVIGTRFGTVWTLRLAAFLLAGAALAGRRSRGAIAAFGLACAFLVGSPALSGHASSQSPEWLLVVSTTAHVGGMSAWVGGLALLVGAVPAATRALPAGQRTPLLSAVLARFSPIALGAVAVLLATGIVQSVVYLSAWPELPDTAFGRAILVKAALLVVLIGFGAHHRRRSLPRIVARAGTGASPGAAGVILRRALRAEVGVLVVVLGVTAALASYSPTQAGSNGPFAAERDLGPLRLELTMDPARAGRNEIHLYLFRRSDGSQFSAAKEVTVEASLPDKEIGPLPLDARRSGPGHYTVPGADLAPGGQWQLSTTVRVSDFDDYATKVEVPVR